MDETRPYAPRDRAACLALFDGNVPRFFTEAERVDFADLLDSRSGDWAYKVVERDSVVVACGGVALGVDGRTAGLCWGMVARDRHRAGLGRALTEARLAVARALGATQVRLDTSQHAQGFYTRQGFVVERVTADGYGPGLDRWDMILRL